MADTVLGVRGLSKRFGGVVALSDATIDFRRSAATSIVGPNGSGKTTLLDCVTAFTDADGGSVLLEGRPIDRATRRARVRAGIRRTFQAVHVFPGLSVVDHLLLAQQELQGTTFVDEVVRSRRFRRSQAAALDAADEALDLVELTHVKHNVAEALSYGQQKLLGLACALVVEPLVLLLDEPLAGVNPRLRRSVLGILDRLRRRGLTLVVVEHDMDFVSEISDWVVVMAEGSVIAQGTPRILQEDDLVFHTLMGGRPPGIAGDAE
jgi:branched-chain amino acid transport system ATP-binding protein